MDESSSMDQAVGLWVERGNRELLEQQRLWTQVAAGANTETFAPAAGAPAAGRQSASLEVLDANRRLVELLMTQRSMVMRAAREGGASWEAIGAALGISRQGAYDWYTRNAVERQPSATARPPEAPAPGDLASRGHRGARRRVAARGDAPARGGSHPAGGEARREDQSSRAAGVRPEGALLGGDRDGQH